MSSVRRFNRADRILYLVLACGAGCAGATPNEARTASTAAAPPVRTNLADRGAAGLAAIRGEGISARMRFLSDDALEGRGPGERGYAVAARYVAAEMASFGLSPAGERGDFFQTVPMRATKLDFAKCEMRISGGKGAPLDLKIEKDFIPGSDGVEAVLAVDAPLVFVGYGISAPEYGYDDMAGIDLRGKVAVALFGAPLSDREDFFPPSASAHYGMGKNKIAAIMKRGAKGLLTIEAQGRAASMPWARAVDGARFERMEWLETKGGRDGSMVPGFRATLSRAMATQILARGGIADSIADLMARAEKKDLRGRDLGLALRGKMVSTFRELGADNVAGVLPGADPALAREHVVYTAHLDHMGIGPAVGGDTIYNGAFDNASGSAAVLEIARAFAALPVRPRRSVMFLFVTAEERGLLGSDYFAAHPTVPAESIVANINIDGGVPLWPFANVEGIGAEHSTLSDAVAEAAVAMGVGALPDGEPELNVFVRSDQYSFAKRGIPSVFLIESTKDAQGRAEKNKAIADKWRAEKYHQPSDEWSRDMLFGEGARLAKVAFLTGLAVAEKIERPSWKPGDFFGTKKR